MWPGQYEPTPAHRFLQKLHEHRKLKRCFTQNIDSLEAAAGLPKEMVVAAHGNFDEAHVVGTGARVDVTELKRAIFEGDREGGLVKPAITFFGEELPARFGECVCTDFAHCRLLLIFGTSLQRPTQRLTQRLPPTSSLSASVQ
ncbi:histone sir2 family [Chrysochromulina tobinii]|uniref:Histone sir2 family n=1 Tax=Chrysochromulina tobinii TaxID=1460289 RepID=A0A0M0JGN1_9EUKA|nr:histone sir2 family [Chrysochromulina tobinii]|eukprot:KOO25610.1 histone sir2 family [Chrysochromulina sp. CCMP291]